MHKCHALWIYWGVSQTCLTALFADSTPDGERLHYFTQRLIVGRLARMFGPAVGLVMFYFLGDDWTTQECANVIAAAQVVAMPCVVLLWFLRDEHADDDMEPADEASHNGSTSAKIRDYGTASSQSSGISLVSVGQSDDNQHSEETRDGRKDYLFFAINLSIFEATTFLAAGLSLKFFPIFFMENLHLHPSIVQIIYLINPLGQIPLVHVVKALASRFGRIQVTAVMSWLGTLSLFAMILFYHSVTRYNPTTTNITWTCAFFVARMWLMNSTLALRKSALMDAVPKKERARWGALESFNSATWAGSAFIGGFLVTAHSVLFNFAVTGIFQIIAIIPLLFIFREVATFQRKASTSDLASRVDSIA
jgi:hypothetical protein